MILIGDKLVPYEDISVINSLKDIKDTKANSTIIFNYDSDLLKYSNKNSISFAVIISSIKESIYANALNAKYIICKQGIAKDIQKIAETYIFDSKVLAIVSDSNEIERIACDEIDGIIYSELLN